NLAVALAGVPLVRRLNDPPDQNRHERQAFGAIDLLIHRCGDADGGRAGDLLEPAADRVLETVGAVEVGRDQSDEAGHEPDDQQGDEKLLLQAACSEHTVPRRSCACLATRDQRRTMPHLRLYFAIRYRSVLRVTFSSRLASETLP